jgi:hypothetical protein
MNSYFYSQEVLMRHLTRPSRRCRGRHSARGNEELSAGKRPPHGNASASLLSRGP